MMTRLRCGWTLALAFVLTTQPAHAHEKWFTDSSSFPIRWSEVFSAKTGLVLLAVGAGLAAAYAADALRRRMQLEPGIRLSHRQLELMFSWTPLLLGIHAAVPLLVSGLQLNLFAPNLPLPRNLGGGLLALAEITIALSFLYGALTRVFALLLLALIPMGFLVLSPAYVLEHLDLAGIAAFLFITGRGPFSVDALIGPPSRPSIRLLPHAVTALRMLTGAAIVVLGFTEKIWNEQLAQGFLVYQDFNLLETVGLDNATFILLAGVVEVLVGAVLISGKLTRLVIALAWIPFNLTLPFLGWVELVGHLSIYGTMVVLLLWGPGQDLEPYVDALSRVPTAEPANKPV